MNDKDKRELTFRVNLNKAIKRLSKERIDILQRRFPGIAARNKLISAALGMRNQARLSEIGKPTKPGLKYREMLADVLDVDLDWLIGRGGYPPDWDLEPIQAWIRYANMLRERAEHIDDSGSLDAEEDARFMYLSKTYADRYEIDSRSDEPAALAAGRYDEVPFEKVLLHARACGVRDPHDIKHVQRGRDEWVALHGCVADKVAVTRNRMLQYFPPKALFVVMRQSLLAYRETCPKEVRAAVDDALEMLWRQQWRAIGKLRDDPMPAVASRDTSRAGWSTLRSIRDRWICPSEQSPNDNKRILNPFEDDVRAEIGNALDVDDKNESVG